MRKLFYIFLMLLTLNSFAKFEPKDTCKIQLAKIDPIPTIVHSTFNSIMNSNFINLTMFCNSSVEYKVLENGNEYSEKDTEVKAMQNLNHLIIKFDIQSFKILTAKNVLGNDIIISELILSKDDKFYKMNIVFILDYNYSINQIIIY